jgi:uncharacterized protein involved in exopolysaccharide biosynthesis
MSSARREVVEDPDQLQLVAIANTALRQRSLIVTVVLVALILALAYMFIKERTYTSTSLFMPQARQMPSNIAGFAEQFGLSVPTSEATASPAFYVELVRSRELLGQVVDTVYAIGFEGTEREIRLEDFLGADGSSGVLRRERTINELQDHLSAVELQESGLVRLRVTMRNGELAAQVNGRILRLLDRFNLERRSNEARAERAFVERRLEEVREDLRAAEDELKRFLQRNREYSRSPELTFQRDRLVREVTHQEALYTELAQSVERARIEEVRNTPMITVVETPREPPLPDPRRIGVRVSLVFFFAVFVGGVLAHSMERVEARQRYNRDEVEEFRELRRSALRDLKRPWRLIGLRTARSNGGAVPSDEKK